MKGILLLLLATSVGATILNDQESRIKRDDSDDSFEEALREGNELLRNEVNADDTMDLIRKLHAMESEIREELADPVKPSAEVLRELKSYGDTPKSNLNQKGGKSIEQINRGSKVASALFQGDIILTKQQADEIMEDVKANEGTRKKRQAFRDKNYPNTTWTNGVNFAYYNASGDAWRVFKKAVAIWGWETCINFGEGHSATDKILVMESVGCWSHIGRIGGSQGLSLGAGCEAVGIAVHEIGHALGLFHTQSRHDRDRFVSIDFSNIEQGWETQFVKQTEETNYNYNLTYDYGSVMHYGATGSSINGEPFMWPVSDMKYLPALGSHILSFYDKLMVNLHYGCLKKCEADSSSAKCENGGFPHPRDCSKCSCPSGYGGRLCNERPPGCGKTLTATKEFQTLNDTVGRWDYDPSGDNDEFYTCHYWIQAPPGSTIEVVLDDYTENVAQDGCIFAGVEIKTLADKRHTGYRFCSQRYIGTRLVSTHNIVPVITYSRLHQTNTVLRYRLASTGPEPSETTSQPEQTTPKQPDSSSSKRCNAPILCALLEKFGLCSNPSYDAEFKEKFCPGTCA